MKSLLLACVAFITFSSFTDHETITGNGNLKKETRKASNYTGISLSGHMNVEIAYGNSNDVTIEADENLLPYIETKVEDGNLVIRAKDKVNLKSRNKMIINASATKLANIKIMGSGNINGKGDFTNDGRTSIDVMGSGNVNLAFNSFNETKVSIAGSGNVDLKGKHTNNVTASVSGSGDINCSDVRTNDAFANVSGSGNIKVYATRTIDAKISGSGNVYYKGDAPKVSVKTSGSGRVMKA